MSDLPNLALPEELLDSVRKAWEALQAAERFDEAMADQMAHYYQNLITGTLDEAYLSRKLTEAVCELMEYEMALRVFLAFEVVHLDGTAETLPDPPKASPPPPPRSTGYAGMDLDLEE